MENIKQKVIRKWQSIKKRYPKELNIEGLEPALISDILELVDLAIIERDRNIMETIKDGTSDILPLPDNAKDFMGDFERGTVGGAFYVKQTIINLITNSKK